MISDDVPTEELLHEQIESCMNLLHRFDEAESEDEEGKSSLTDLFMSALLKLYLTVKQEPGLEEAALFQNFLQSSVPLMARTQSYIVRFQMRIESLFHVDPDYDPWEAVCWMRSAFQAFLEMYQFTLGTDLQEKYIDLSFADFDPEDIDDVIEAYILHKTPVPEDEIPVGMPRSHWWWWGEKAEESLPA
jgi:hypothetical protein